MSKELAPYNIDTYHNRELYRKVKEDGDLKPIWAHKNAKKWGVEAEPFLTLCKDNCPLCGSLLDYGVGDNLLENRRDYQTPSTDHKKPRSEGGDNSIENFWIICMRCNTLKNNSTAQDLIRYENIVRFLKGQPLIDIPKTEVLN